MSIAKAQALAIADGFLDTVGGDRSDLRPRNTFSEMILLAGELVDDCQTNLHASNNNASGKLSASLTAGEPTRQGSALKIDILMNFYGLFVNKGVKGTKSGSSAAGYSFKNDFPSQKMVDAIREWAKRGKISTASVKKYKGYGEHELKNKRIAQIDNAYAAARSIKQQGLKANGFLDKAIQKTQSKVADRLGLALKIDITNFLTNI